MSDNHSDLPEDDLNRKGFITTYPPSRHWKGTFKPQVLDDNRLNLYIHVPYCIQRCAYCFFKITELSDSNQSEIDKYVDYLCREFKMVSDLYGWKNRPVDTLYFGGGTPSLLKARHLDQIMAALNDNFTMALTEFVFEVEPITYSKSKAKELSDFGITRLSFGIQSFHDEIVKKTGRKDTEKMNIAAIERALDTGVILNIDLLSGLEGETEATWHHSVDRAISLDVQSITVYKMELYQNSRYYDDIRQDTIILPSDEQEMVFINYALERLYNNDYLHSTYFTFTKGGEYRQKHLNQRWLGEDTYGFGVSAFSSLEREYLQNTSNTDNYIAAIDEGKLPLERGMALTSVDLITRDIVMMMKTSRLDTRVIRRRHGVDLLSENNTMLKHLIDQEFVYVEDRTIHMTRKGVLYGDFSGKMLCRQFLASLS